jgi:peroxiredoxin Q/BCP
LSDEDGTLCELYGVWKEKLNYGKKYMGIERTTFLMDVDQKGKATITHVYPKVKVKGHVDEILKAIKK